MAFYDWNQNGRNDTADDFMEYNIYQNIGHGQHSGNLRWQAVLVTIVILFVIGWFVELAETDDTYRHESYGQHNYSTTNYNSKIIRETGLNQSSKSTVNKSITVPKQSTYDTYNVKDYSDAEDFYDDNQDDFEDEEEAEDYYNDVMDE